MKHWMLVLGAIFLFSAAGAAERDEKPPRRPTVTASGEAVITVEPDQAEIDIGVVTQARNAPAAAKENAEKLTRVMGELKKLLGKADEIKTASYALTPNYRYPQGGKPELVGYTATNIVRIKTGNLADVGKLIDAGMQSGANTIHRLVFTLKDEQSAQLHALRSATAKAKAKAQEIAGALGLKIIKVLAVSEGERGVRPIVMPYARMAQMEAAASPPTPVESGTIEVRSTVTLTGELGGM